MLVGPGEGAGVIDVGDGIAAAIRIESHNHPSAIEPYQGAATGRRRHPPRHLHHGRPADRPDGPAALRPARRAPQPLDRSKASSAASPATATRSACRPSAARWSSTRPTPTTRSSTCSASASCPSTGWCSAGPQARATSPCCSARPPGATASAARRMASEGFSDDEADAGQAARRPGRRPVRGEAADRGVPGAARRRPRGGSAGPRRRRHHLRHQRDRRPRAGWAWTSTSAPSTAGPRAWSRGR